MITIRSEGGKTKPYIKEYMVDTIAELEHLPRHVATGSSAICLEDQSQYMLNGTSEWVKFEMGGSGGGGEDILFQEKTVEITENGATEITADEGYALSKATVKVEVESTGKLPQVVDRTVTELTAEDLAGATKIGDYAFSGCQYLTSIAIPDSVTSIGFSAFSDCRALTSIDIPDSVTSIGYHAFRSCNSLTSVTIGNSVESIGDYAFYECIKLTSVTIGNSVTSIGSSAFQSCIGLTSIEIPDSVTSIEGSAFYGCYNLTSVTIPDSVTSIGPCAFQGCSSFSSVRIGGGIVSIGSNAFYGCSFLSDIYIDAEKDSVSGAPWGATNATVHWNTPLPTEEA